MGRIALGLLFVVGGVLHFAVPRPYLAIMPPMLPSPLLLVDLSGLCEMIGGIGVLIPRTRRLGAWIIVALLVAVWPANIHMALAAGQFAKIPPWVLWVRVPMQLPLIAWAWRYTRATPVLRTNSSSALRVAG